VGASELEQVDGAVAGAWIKPALDGDWGGRVKNFVPQIYEAYARVFHPASDPAGKDVTWAEVARRLGTVAHREMQWHAIVGTADPDGVTDSRWPGQVPSIMEPPASVVDALVPILAAHTGTPESAYFGMSTIRSGVRDEWPGVLYEQTAREWVILRGPLAAVDQIGFEPGGAGDKGLVWIASGIRAVRATDEAPAETEGSDWVRRESPNLIWPEDRAWFVQSEYDYDSTVLGGSRALVDALLASPDLEVWDVDGEVALTEDADELNPVPDPPRAAERQGSEEQ